MSSTNPINTPDNPTTTLDTTDVKVLDPKLSFVREWQTESYISEIQELVSCNETIMYINKMTETLNKMCECTGTTGDTPNSNNNISVEKIEWETLHDVASNIMQEYTNKIDDIITKLNDLNRRVILWQESSFIMDSHRGIDQVNNIQEWITLKETYLDYKRRVLKDSMNEIKNTVARLPNN